MNGGDTLTHINRLLTVPDCLFYDTLMHKTDLVKHLAKKNRRSQEHYQTALNEILAGIQEQLSQGKEVVLTGFGTFYTRHRKGGKGMNFKTRKRMEYQAVRQAAFKVGTLLKQAVRRKKITPPKPRRSFLSRVTGK